MDLKFWHHLKQFCFRNGSWLLTGLVLILLYSTFSEYLSVEQFVDNKVFIADFINKYYTESVVLFYLSCLIFINTPFPLAAIIKLLGGFFFGFKLGAIFNITATLLACLAGFALSRHIFRQRFERRYYQKLEKIEHELEDNGFYYFLSLRLIMLVPYFLINALAGLSRISFRDYLTSTALGVIPASLIYANGGSHLEQVHSIYDLFQFETGLSLAMIALLALVPVIYSKRKPHLK